MRKFSCGGITLVTLGALHYAASPLTIDAFDHRDAPDAPPLAAVTVSSTSGTFYEPMLDSVIDVRPATSSYTVVKRSG